MRWVKISQLEEETKKENQGLGKVTAEKISQPGEE